MSDKETEKNDPAGPPKAETSKKKETRGRPKLVDARVKFGSIYSKGKYYEKGEIVPLKEEDLPLLIKQGLIERV